MAKWSKLPGMHARLVLTIIGPDRPGIVDAVSATIASAQGSWQKSRFARLADHFAGIVEVTVPSAAASGLTTALQALPGLSVTVTPATLEALPTPARVAHFSFVGQDRPGLVQALSRVLAAAAVNVAELETRTFLAPMSGVSVFEAEAEVHLPAGLDVAQLTAQLETVARDLVVDIVFHEEPL